MRVTQERPAYDGLLGPLAEYHRRRLSSTPGAVNEMRITPTSLGVVRRGTFEVCSLTGVVTDYAAWVAAQEEWASLDVKRRARRCLDGLTGLQGQGIGVNLTVLCSDGMLVMVKRSPNLAWHPGRWGTMSEGSSITDASMNEQGLAVWDPVVTAVRGLEEELGVSLLSTVVKFHSVVCDVSSGSLSAVGVARLNIPGSKVLDLYRSASDGGEASAIDLFEWGFSLGDVFVERGIRLVPLAAYGLAGAFALDAGWSEVFRRGLLVEV